METERHESNLSKLLAVGKNVKTSIYAELIKRVSAGDILTATEIATFEKLHKELSGESPPAPSLPNRITVATYLRKGGYKISKSTLYKHEAEGRIRPQSDGTYAVADVDAYAKLYLPRLDGSRNELDDHQRERILQEIRKTSAQAAHWEIRAAEASGAVMPRDSFEKEIAARAIIFRSDGTNWIHAEAPKIIALVAGDITLLPDLIEFMLSGLESWVGRYSGERDFTADLPAPSPASEPITVDDMEGDE